jgi:ring-1,2-phenylacetyl-CoA epoxidase subunit PaaE
LEKKISASLTSYTVNRRMVNYSLKIVDIRVETPDTKTIVFKQPGLKKIKYLAGQYLTLIFRINGRKYVRPYSFSSAPIIDTSLEITVKRVPGGIVSNHIIDCLNVGDIVEVMEPMGDFVLRDESVNEQTHLILWGAGSGITPLISLAKHALYNNIVKHVTLVYGNRNFDSVIFKDNLDGLVSQYPNHFRVWHFHTNPSVSELNPFVVQGRIDAEKVLSVLKSEGDLTNTLHYVCGPIGLKESVKLVLDNLEVESEHVYSEDFQILINPEAFKDIKTRVVNIKQQETSTAVEVAKGKSILEAGLDAMIDMTYSCQTGNCLICKGTLLSGELKTIGVGSLPPELKHNEWLLCCSYPLSDNIEILI